MSPPRHMSKRRAEKSTTRTGDPRALELLRAKLDVPPPRPGLVERTALVGRLSGVSQTVGPSRSSHRRVTAKRTPGTVAARTVANRVGLARPPRQRSRRLSDVRRRGAERRLDARARSVQGAQGHRRLAVGAWASASRHGAGGPARAVRARPRRRARAREPRMPGRPCVTTPPRAARVALVLSGRTEARQGLPKLRADGELLELGPAESP